jgi:hypothetical protein
MSRLGLGLVSSVLLLSVIISSACSNIADDCETTSTCGPVGGTNASGTTAGGQSGKSGGGNTGGSVNAGEGGNTTAGTASAGSSGSATAGAGGVGGGVTLPCDGACSAPTPVCDEPNDTCVECLVEADCTTAAKSKCDADAKACVACLESADCSTPGAAKCDAGACVKCTSNDDCGHIAGKTVCDTDAGECVQCTGKDYASCGMSGGKPLVCDSATRSCSTSKEHSAGLCSPCLSDAQCGLGQLCVKEQFGTPKQDVGYFCFWKQGAAEGGAPVDCTLPTNRPYVAALKNQSSIDGAAATVCGLRTSTCTARNQFSAKDCSTSSLADDNKCGFAPTKDSKCLPFGASQFRCTTTCLSNDDCDEASSCDVNATPKVCQIEQ